MLAIKKFDINSINDYYLGIKLYAHVFIKEPDSSLSEDFQEALKKEVYIPKVVYGNGVELYLERSLNMPAYQPSDLLNSKAIMAARYDINCIESCVKDLNDALATLKSEADDDTKFNAVVDIWRVADRIDSMFIGE